MRDGKEVHEMNETTRKMLAAFAKTAVTDPVQREAALAALAPRKEERPDKWIKTKEALALCGFASWKTLRRAEKAGKLHPRHLSARMVRWSRNELENWLCGTGVQA